MFKLWQDPQLVHFGSLADHLALQAAWIPFALQAILRFKPQKLEKAKYADGRLARDVGEPDAPTAICLLMTYLHPSRRPRFQIIVSVLSTQV